MAADGNRMAIGWQVDGKSMASPWQVHGKSMAISVSTRRRGEGAHTHSVGERLLLLDQDGGAVIDARVREILVEREGLAGAGHARETLGTAREQARTEVKVPAGHVRATLVGANCECN